MKTRVIVGLDEFATLAGPWERLQEQAKITSIFASYDWQSLWWKHYHRDRPLRLLVASEGDSPLGILPLYIDRQSMLGYPVSVLRLVGTGGDTSPDDLGPVLAPEREDEVARALAQAVLDLPGWDVMTLTDVDPGSAFAAVMGPLAPLSGRSQRIPFAELPATFDDWLRSLGRNRRYRLRRDRRRLERNHQSRFFRWTDAATLDEGIDRLIHLHRKRWQRKGERHSFSSDEYVAFHRELMHVCFARDRLRLYGLEIDGEIAAMAYFYRFRKRIYLMQAGFDPDLEHLRPGLVLLGHIFESAIGEGFEVLDFLRGDHRYKHEHETGARETVYLTAFRRRPGALVYQLRKRLLPALRRTMRERARS